MLKKITLIIVFISFSAQAQIFDKSKIDSLLSSLEQNDKVMGSMFITKNNKKGYSNSIGYSSIEKNRKASDKTKYRIGSITKMYTGVMIFQLIDDHRLSIETPLSNFFPTIKNSQKITIGNLLSHTSGIFNFTRKKDFNPYIAQTHEQMLVTIEEFKPDFEPDAKTAYSNTNFILLGYILEKKYNKPYAEILKNQIVSKLNLKNTYYGGSINIENFEAESYTFSTKWEKSKETDMSLPHGAGAIVSTPEELTIFMNALMDGKLISKSSFKKMTTIKSGLGYGIGQFSIYDKMLFGHNGGIDGFSSLLIYEPEEKISIAFTSNGSTLDIKNIVIDGLKAVMNTPFKLSSSIEISSEELANYTGLYTSLNAPFTLTFLVKEGKLLGGPTGHNDNILKAIKEHQFKLESEGVTLDFNLEENSLIMSQGGRTFIFTRKTK